MKTELKVLMLEADVNDAELVGKQLRNGGFPVRVHRVESQKDFANTLANDIPDIILSDHGLPGFNGFQALALAQKACPEVPFVLVADGVGAGKEIETLKKGGIHFVFKNHLSRLVPVVQQVLREAEQRRARRRQEESLREDEDVYRSLLDGVRDYAICRLDEEGRLRTSNSGAENVLGYGKHEIVGWHFSLFYPAESRAIGKPARALSRAILNGRFQEETVLIRKDGKPFWAEVIITPLPGLAGDCCDFALVVSDITARREMEDRRERTIQELQVTLNHVKILSGLLPVCIMCKQIRDDKGQWHPLEAYLRKHSEAILIHEFCGECFKRI